MGKVRDFTQDAIDNIRENLVDKNPDWDAFTDTLWNMFSFNKTLDEDLGNFDKYMARICEINDITAQKLDAIVADVHSIEATYEDRFFTHSSNTSQCGVMLSRMLNEISKPDFERSFNKADFAARLGGIRFRDLTWDFSTLSPEALAAVLQTLTSEEVAALDITNFTQEQRKVYFQEIYRRLATEDFSANPGTKQALLDALKQMTYDDRMAIVFDENGQYGGDQGAPFSKDDALVDYVIAYYAAMGITLTEQQARDILDKIGGVGCNYTAAINSILLQYANNPEGFEETFGFPMYVTDANGNVVLNFNQLLVAFYLYCKENGYESGLTEIVRSGLLQGFLDENDSSYDIQRDPENSGEAYLISGNPDYAEHMRASIAAGKTVVMVMKPTFMYDSEGKPIREQREAHAVVVTGVAANGDLIISSWGNQYTIKASEFGRYSELYYTVTEYTENA